MEKLSLLTFSHVEKIMGGVPYNLCLKTHSSTARGM